MRHDVSVSSVVRFVTCLSNPAGTVQICGDGSRAVCCAGWRTRRAALTSTISRNVGADLRVRPVPRVPAPPAIRTVRGLPLGLVQGHGMP